MELSQQSDLPEDIDVPLNFNYKLIGCIKKYPAIYAKQTKQFRNLIKKDAAWRYVAHEMEMSGKWVHSIIFRGLKIFNQDIYFQRTK